MPNFYFSEEEIEAITTAVLAFNSNKIGEKLIASNKSPDIYKEGHRLVKQYNCQGCHLIENRGGQLVEQMGKPEYAPPNLNSEGEKQIQIGFFLSLKILQLLDQISRLKCLAFIKYLMRNGML